MEAQSNIQISRSSQTDGNALGFTLGIRIESGTLVCMVFLVISEDFKALIT